MVSSPPILTRFLRARARGSGRVAAVWDQRWSLLREVARGSAALLLFLFPTLISSIDHHGIERMPLHIHFVPGGGPTPTHAHGFETPHQHGVDDGTPQKVVLETRWSGAEALAPSSIGVIGIGITLLECALAILWLASSGSKGHRSIRTFIHRPGAAFLGTLKLPPRSQLLAP